MGKVKKDLLIFSKVVRNWVLDFFKGKSIIFIDEIDAIA